MTVDETLPPDGHDEEAEVRPATRELLPEERAAGSDDPQAQAKAILQESQERLEQSDHDSPLD